MCQFLKKPRKSTAEVREEKGLGRGEGVGEKCSVFETTTSYYNCLVDEM